MKLPTGAIDRHRHGVEVGGEMRALVGGRRHRVGTAAATQRRPHARRQLTRAERLGDVVVGAGVEAGHAIALGRARREHDDRHGGGGRTLAQDAAHLEAVEYRQVQVEDHEIGRLFCRRLQRGVTAAHRLDGDVPAA
ncbi:MAG: hypothetical protein U0P30_05770 [Vicinamibacterales bacterium]